MLDRLLEDWAEQGVVAHDDRTLTLRLADLVGDPADQRDIHDGVHRVRGRFHQHHGDAAL
jgi:hypothetical protein